MATLEYDQDLFERRTIRRMAADYRCPLEAIVADPEARIGGLPLPGVPHSV
jgi:hypothetical protein